jgi:hypothetical protein
MSKIMLGFDEFINNKEESESKSEYKDKDLYKKPTENANKLADDGFIVHVMHEKINEEYMKMYDFYEIYDKNKDYKYEEYKAIYKHGIEKTYINFFYSKVESDDDNLVKYVQNFIYNDTSLKSAIGNINSIEYVIAQEVYDNDELKILEKYCACNSCKERRSLSYYRYACDACVHSAIDLTEYTLGYHKAYDYKKHFEKLLNVTYDDSCISKCIKSGWYWDIEMSNIINARKILKTLH